MRRILSWDASAVGVDILVRMPKLRAMTNLKRFFHRDPPVGEQVPILGEEADRVRYVDAAEFARLYRLRSGAIKSAQVIPPRLGAKDFGKFRVVLRGGRFQEPRR